jgi:Uma2 family endonuclease
VIVDQPTADTARLTTVPDLVFEVLSHDRSADTVKKFAKYAAAGLPLYWVVDPDGPSLPVFELDQVGGFREG